MSAALWIDGSSVRHVQRTSNGFIESPKNPKRPDVSSEGDFIRGGALQKIDLFEGNVLLIELYELAV